MKKIKLLSIFSILAIGFTSCVEDNDALTGNKNIGGLVKVEKALVPYVIGDGVDLEYSNGISAYQGPVKVTKVKIYKTFTDTKNTPSDTDDVVSNENLLTTIDVPVNTQNANVNYTMTFTQLVDGLVVDGVAMTNDDTQLNIGDYFTLRYEQVRSDGVVVMSSAAISTKVAVGTRLAGTYRCIDALYYRIGVLTATTGNWPAETVIESVDATTYRVVRRFGYFPSTATDTNTWFFNVNANVITYPLIDTDTGSGQTGNDQPFITCESNPADFVPQVNCGDSNYVVLDNVAGKDKLYMTFGYLSPSGPRVFYQVLEKK